jgi:two-component system, NarL family, response regulator
MIDILLVDDHPMMRMGLTAVLQQESDMQVVGEADSGEAGLALFQQLQADIVLMDLRLPGINGIQTIQQMLTLTPNARILVVTTFDGDEDIRRALRTGARGYLLKDTLRKELIDAIRHVHAGKRYLSPLAESRLKTEEGTALSAREVEILEQLVDGKSNREIASLLGISEGTVRIHLSNIFEKMGVHDRTRAAIVAIQRGFVALR